MALLRSRKSQETENPLLMPPVQLACKPIFVQLQSETPLGNPMVIGVTSPSRGDGRSTLTLGLASAAAAVTGKQGRVLVVDADIANPTLHLRCGVGRAPGLYEVVTGQVPVNEVIVGVKQGVWLLPAGSRPVNLIKFLKKLQELDILTGFGSQCDAVFVDLPPAYTPELGVLPPRLVPRLVMVTRAGTTRLDQLRSAVDTFPPECICAVVLNEYRERIPRMLRPLLDMDRA